MKMEDFTKGVMILSAGVGREFSAATCKVWFEIVRDLTVEEWLHAIERYLAESESAFPLPAILRRYAMEHRHGVAPTAGEAFSAVVAAVRRFDLDEMHGMAALPDDLTRAAVNACGGWRAFANLTDDNRQVVSAQFRMAYESLATRHEKLRALPERLRPAIGLSNGQRTRMESGAVNVHDLERLTDRIGRGGAQ